MGLVFLPQAISTVSVIRQKQIFLFMVYAASPMSNVRKRLGLMALFALMPAACVSNNDNAHTTATTLVSPPPRQMLRVGTRPSQQIRAQPDEANKQVDPKKPLLTFNLPNGKTFREGEEVVIDFSLANAKLKGDGGDYRVRYIVDDEDMKWIDRWEQVVLTGWTPGKHTIRLELVGPDGWPYSNGDYNIVTRELMVTK